MSVEIYLQVHLNEYQLQKRDYMDVHDPSPLFYYIFN